MTEITDSADTAVATLIEAYTDLREAAQKLIDSAAEYETRPGRDVTIVDDHLLEELRKCL